MSFREKTAWVSMVSSIGVYAYYFLTLWTALRAGEAEGGRFLGLFVLCVFAMVVIQVAAAILMTVLAPKEAILPIDERERAIERRAGSAAFFALNGLVLTAAMFSPIYAGISVIFEGMSAPEVATFLMANAILLAVVLSDFVYRVWQILFYRLGR
jgi:hypothetical protein